MHELSKQAPRILLADDDEAIRETLAHFLKAQGYAVDEARNGREALEIIVRNNVSYLALLTDFDMPHLNGIQLIEAVARENGSIHNFVLMSAFDEKNALIQPVRSLGFAVTFLKKPFSLETLESVLEEFHDGRKTESAVF